MRRRLRIFLGQAPSGAVLMREAVRTSRRWQTWVVRTGFSGALLGILLVGLQAAGNAIGAADLDTANLAWLGRGLFVGVSVALTLLAVAIAPVSTASAIIEETEEHTLEMLTLTPLGPTRILGATLLSRIGVLLTVVAGAMPVLALVANLGGVGTFEILAVGVHGFVTVVVMAALGAFFALFTKSPALAAVASAGWTLPFFVLLPSAYAMATGDLSDVPQFSAFATGMAADAWALVTPLSLLPSLVVIGGVTVPLFGLAASNADLQHSFSDAIWRTPQWGAALFGWLVTALFSLPVAVPIAYWLQNAAVPPFGALTGPIHAVVLLWIWLLFSMLAALGTWVWLRVGMDVVDGLDSLFRGASLTPASGRASRTVSGANPVWWREARPAAWLGTAAPVFVGWTMIGLGVFQSGAWVVPGGLLTIGFANGAAAIAFGAWLAARSVAEERRRGTLDLLLVTTMPARDIVGAKLAGAALPTLPLLLLALPCVALGLPHLHLLSLADGARGAGLLFLRGLGIWLWLVPVWGTALVASMTLARRLARPQAAFSLVTGGLVAILGPPAILARILPDVPLVTVPARIVAPPLAGGFAGWQLALSVLATSLLCVVLLRSLVRNLRDGARAGLGALLLLALSAPAGAEPPDPTWIAGLETINRIRMVAHPLADGIGREDVPTTVRVRIQNDGPGTTGTLSIPEQLGDTEGTRRSWTRTVELPAGTVREVLLVFAPGVGEPDRLVTLGTREGRTAIAPFRVRPTGRNDVTIGVVGTDPLGLTAIRDATAEPVPGRRYRPTTTAPDGAAPPPRLVHVGLVSPADLPRQSAGLRALDWLVWPGADPTGIPADRIDALRGWIADGGHLLLTVGGTWRQLSDSALAPALPVVLDGQREADPGALARLLDLPSVPLAPIAVATVRPDRDAEIRARTPDGAPLWVSAPYGLGSIHVVLAELGTGPLPIRSRPEGWRRLLGLPGVGGTVGDQLALEGSIGPGVHRMLHLDWVADGGTVDPEARIRNRLADIPGVAPLPLPWLLAFSVVYLLAIGPLDYLVLRAIGRPALTWITFPVLIVGFTGASLWLTTRAKGSQTVLTRVELVDVLPGTGLGRGTTWLGVFSTRKARTTLAGGFDDAVVAPLAVAGFQNDPVLEAGGGAGSLSWSAETWTLAYARSDWTAPLPGTLEIVRDGGELRVRNALGRDLDDVGVGVGDAEQGRVAGWTRLGPLADGATVAIPAHAPTWAIGTAPPDDTLGWAFDTFAASLPTARGDLQAVHGTLVLGIGREPIEPVVLVGAEPVEQVLSVVRMVVRCDDDEGRPGPCTVESP